MVGGEEDKMEDKSCMGGAHFDSLPLPWWEKRKKWKRRERIIVNTNREMKRTAHVKCSF